MAINVNDTAPDFTLKNTKGEEVSLSDFRGKKNTVLLFFPLAFTSTCTEELCAMRDNLKIYDSLNAEVIGVSSADSFFVLRQFKSSQNLNFTLLSDFNKEAAEKYGVLYNDFYGMKGVSKRAVFVIDKEGIVQHKEVIEDASNIPDLDRIVDILVKLE